MNFEDDIVDFSEEYRQQKAPAGAQAAALNAWVKSHSRSGFSLLSVPVVSAVAVAVLVIAAVVVPFLLEPAAPDSPPALSFNQFSTPVQPSIPSIAILPMSMPMPSLPAGVELTIPRLNQISTPRIQTEETI